MFPWAQRTPQSVAPPAVTLLSLSVLAFAAMWGSQFLLIHHFAPEVAADSTSYWFVVAMLSCLGAFTLCSLFRAFRVSVARVLRPNLPGEGFANQQLAAVYLQARRCRAVPADERRHLPTKEQLRLTAASLQAKGLGPYQSRACK